MEASNSAFLFADDSLESRSSASSAFDSVVSLELSFQDCSHLQKVEDCGALHLEADRICKDLLPEKEEGNVEFKYKLVRVNEDRLEHLVTQMNYRLTEGNGKAFYFVGVEDNGVAKGLPDNLLAETIRTLLKMTKKLNCELFIDFIK